jgi:dihydrofolate synthase/folylpolyglutamate synthase
VITPISYEHTDKLGDTLTKIAAEKAGIVKEGAICVIASQEEEPLKTINKICSQRMAKAITVGKDIKFKEFRFDDSTETFTVSGLFGEYPVLEMSLLGAHQVVNAATAIGAVEALHFRGIDVDREAVKEGVRNARWPGRLEVVSRRPYIILDGAQNRASAKALAEALKRAFKYLKMTLVLGISSDKDIKGILEELIPVADKVILTKAKITERAAWPENIKGLMAPNDKDIYLTNDVEDAMDKAIAFSSPEDLILVTGSLFVVGEARQARHEKI